ncbi:MAG: 6-phospho-3-hexuloisomerase [Candidatus Freyarchaeota archaeon]|nr:6-phospho-3-hexuloisomerase [Candidatus Jordarchaeia archaeon]
MFEICKSISDCIENVNDEEVNRLVELLIDGWKNNKRVFVTGAGRSGLMGRAFAMRLMHLGYEVFVVGETITPAVRKGDILIAISGSGTTKLVLETSKIAKEEIGAKVVAITSYPDSPLGKMADHVVVVKGRTKSDVESDYLSRQMRGEHSPLTPLGTLFESNVLAFLDGLIAELMERTGKKEKDLEQNHAKPDGVVAALKGEE